jgi:hypothetical protein
MSAESIEGLELFCWKTAADNLPFDLKCRTAAPFGGRGQWRRPLHRILQPLSGFVAQIQ